MPKKIDHDSYRLELAQKSALLFSKYGYSGLGMRTIAEELGISKSALYHYFPSKKHLFHACTDLVTQFNMTDLMSKKSSSTEDQVHSLVKVVKELEPTFPQELSLLLDYLRGRSPQDISNDPTMSLANKRYDILIQQFVGKHESKPVLCLLMGALLIRFFDGATTDFDEIETWLIKALN
jgi:AcrR family transcriptional regulator